MNKKVIKFLELGLKEFRKMKIKGASIGSICWLECNHDNALVRIEYVLDNTTNKGLEMRVFNNGNESEITWKGNI